MPERNPVLARERLRDFYMEVEGMTFDASAPEWGDATFGEPTLPGSEVVAQEAEKRDHVTIGLAADEIARVPVPSDRAVLRDRSGASVLEFKIEKVSEDFGVVIGVPLPH